MATCKTCGVAYWFSSPVDVQDPNNTLYGTMSYNVVKSGVGYDNADFNKNGGANFTCTAMSS